MLKKIHNKLYTHEGVAMKQLWYVSLFLAILLGSAVLASTQVYADTQFVGTETAIISKK